VQEKQQTGWPFRLPPTLSIAWCYPRA